MRRIAIAAVVAAAMAAAPSGASAFEVGVQDQGADPATLNSVADEVGAPVIRLIVRPGEPEIARVRAARAAGRRVQAAIVLKRSTTPGDVRSLMRAWDGDVGTVSIGNEPEINGLTACEYADLYRRSYRVIKREYPGTRVGFGEFSPFNVINYTRRAMACKGARIRADFWAIHPYQFDRDPLAPYQKRSGAWTGPWFGIGDLARIRRFLAAKATRARISTPAGRALPIRCTEFTYLVSGRYAISAATAARLWPRVIQQARRWCEQLIIYGTGPVTDPGNWGSASLLDADGYGTPSLWAIMAALGRRGHGRRRPLGPMTGESPAGIGAERERPIEVPLAAEPRSIEEEPAPAEPPALVEPPAADVTEPPAPDPPLDQFLP